jgi:Family of unknown function (DUF5330)
MFLIRMVFWLGLIVVLLPTDERQQARLYNTAVATVERIITFCDRNAQACNAGADFWAAFVKKAEFGARMAVDLISSGGRKEPEAVPTPARVEPQAPRSRPEPRARPSDRGTLSPTDLTPTWRGQLQRTGA